MPVSKAKQKANQKWDSKNKDRIQYLNRRSVTKQFILKLASENDLADILKYIGMRKQELNNKAD